MAEKTELPVVLAEDEDGDTLRLHQYDADDREKSHFVTARSGSRIVTVDVHPAELMRNLAAFVPEVEPVAWLDEDSNLWADADRFQALHWVPPGGVDALAEKVGPLVAAYAHPPVTAEPEVERLRKKVAFLDAALRRAEPAVTPMGVTAEPGTYPKNTVAWIREKADGEWILAIVKDHTWEFMLATNDRITGSVSPLSAAVDVRVIERPGAHPPVTAEPATAPSEPVWAMFGCESGEGFRCFNDGKRAYIEHDGVLWIQEHQATAPSVTDASVDNSDATVRFDLVEGMNVEEWAHKADVATASNRNLMDVITAARDALLAHGFTSDTLESQTLAESIHALAGRGAPSVEQTAEVLMDWVVDPLAAAEAIHALYGTPGDAGEHGSDVVDRTEHERMGERAEKAEAEVQRVMVASHRYASDREDLQQEVMALEEQGERHKAALEAAWEYAAAILGKLSATRENSEAQANARRTEAHVYSASQNVEEKFATALAARAAVEAETSEESGA